MTYEEYLQYAMAYAAEHPEQRMGQALFNALREFDPLLAENLVGTEACPFYEEGFVGPRIRAFHAAVMKGMSH